MTDLEKQLLKLLIQFAWDHPASSRLQLYESSRKLAVTTLGLSDERPLDVEKRKKSLNDFIAAR